MDTFRIVVCLLCSVLPNVNSQDPAFLPAPNNVVTVRGETAILPCTIDNLGPYKTLWSNDKKMLLVFDGRVIVADRRFSLERPSIRDWNLKITNVTQRDAGIYSCSINTNPKTGRDVTLDVINEKPRPEVPQEVVALSGSSVEIKCKLHDTTDVATWIYSHTNGSTHHVSNDTSSRIHVREGSENGVYILSISDVKNGDDGSYVCRAQSGGEKETSLKIIAPPPSPSLTAKALSPNEVVVRWDRPATEHVTISGYELYVRDNDTGKEHVLEVAPGDPSDTQEEFTLEDLTTGTEYTLQIATRYKTGATETLGQRSVLVRIKTPTFSPDPPNEISARRLTNNEAEVSWEPAQQRSPGKIRGYTVFYGEMVGQKLIGDFKTVKVNTSDGLKWRASLTDLRPKTRYQIQVSAFTRRGDGRASKLLNYLHEALPPELSLNARVLSVDSVLLTVDHVGGGRLSNVSMWYTEAKHPSWKRLDFSPESPFAVVGGLEPRTGYFFKVIAKLGGKMKHSVTHITTPPHELQTPQNLEISAKTSTSIEITWEYTKPNETSQMPFGFIVYTEEIAQADDADKRPTQSVVFNKTSAMVKDLTSGKKYAIQVAAFNGFGEGPRADPVLFHIAESEVKTDEVNKPRPPRFSHKLPERVTVTPGEPIKMTCVVDGYPVPDVTWYDNGEPIGVAAQGSNQLVLANVYKSTILTCRGVSQYGVVESRILVDVPAAPELSRLSLVLLTENVRMTTLSVVWMVRGENSREINRFDIIFKDNQGRTLLSQSIPGQTRSFNLRGLAPATEYQVELYAFDDPSSRKAAAEARTTVTTLREDPVTTVAPGERSEEFYRAQLPLVVVDLKPLSAFLEWDFVGLDPRYVQAFELKVKSKSNLTLLSQSMPSNMRNMEIHSLTPETLYYVIVRAFDRQGTVLAHNMTEFVTLSTTSEGARNTDQTSRELRLALSSREIQSDSAVLAWTSDESTFRNITEFTLIVKDTANTILLQHTMTSESRSLTLNHLSPNTRYMVELLGLDTMGSIVTRAVTVVTTKDKSTDSQQEAYDLRIFTEELDTESVKIAWDLSSRLRQDTSSIYLELRDIANVTMKVQQMRANTRSLTVRNLEPGEKYYAHIEARGQDGQAIQIKDMAFDMAATQGMPGRPEIIRVQAINNSAVHLEWKYTPPLSPGSGVNVLRGYAVNYATVDSANQPTGGTYQLPVFGTAPFVVIPNLRPGENYMFQVLARSDVGLGPRSVPRFVHLPRSATHGG